MAPEPESTNALRASDAERERVAAQLRDHAADGRLTTEELGERLEAAYSARTRGELEPLLADLPRERRAASRGRSRTRQGAREHLRAYVVVSVLLVAIWAATGAGYPWPVWPIAGWGIGVLSHVRGGRGLLACGGHRRRAESLRAG